MPDVRMSLLDATDQYAGTAPDPAGRCTQGLQLCACCQPAQCEAATTTDQSLFQSRNTWRCGLKGPVLTSSLVSAELWPGRCPECLRRRPHHTLGQSGAWSELASGTGVRVLRVAACTAWRWLTDQWLFHTLCCGQSGAQYVSDFRCSPFQAMPWTLVCNTLSANERHIRLCII